MQEEVFQLTQRLQDTFDEVDGHFQAIHLGTHEQQCHQPPLLIINNVVGSRTSQLIVLGPIGTQGFEEVVHVPQINIACAPMKIHCVQCQEGSTWLQPKEYTVCQPNFVLCTRNQEETACRPNLSVSSGIFCK
jgi:hypothetical protein